MAKTNPARGMRDFLPAEVRKREYVINIIKQVYESYGYEPLETPAVENIETLMGKYGEEGNQLIFKILKRGEKLRESVESTESIESAKLDRPDRLNRLADLALRYDLTVPLARVVADRRNELPKFFKRYQIQPVWRADRPARGRFREFYQCDVDCIGSESVIVEAELISAVSQILERLGFENFVIRVNHREVLKGMLEVAGISKADHINALTSIDKLDKIGALGVQQELEKKGFSGDRITHLLSFLDASITNIHSLQSHVGTLHQMANFLNEWKPERSSGQYSLARIEYLLAHTRASKFLRFDPSLARGLSYYTGTIMEINVPDLAGSLGGGGRYDGLIGMFGKEQIPACGFSLGLERILVVMDERGMFPPEIADSMPADVMVTLWSEETAAESLKLASELRGQGLRVTLYPEPDKLGKQMKYADSIGVPVVCLLGESEIAENKVTLKNMKTGEQQNIHRTEVAEHITNKKSPLE